MSQNVAGSRLLLAVFRIHAFGVPSAQRETRDLNASALERKNFPPNEGVTYLRVLIDKIGNAHRQIRRKVKSIRTMIPHIVCGPWMAAVLDS